MPVDSEAYQDLVDRIHYSDRYSDDEYEYRHVQLPRQMLKLGELPLADLGAPTRRDEASASLRIGGGRCTAVERGNSATSFFPKDYFEPDSNVMRLLTEDEWRGIGITQSLGWEHYETHAPEPHILLFRREKDYQVKYGNAPRQ
ncbi:hypothetical protein JCM11641_000253 [Rhodosporidiobolus odoratus]